MTQDEIEFCEKLTELLLEYGLGIADEPHMFSLTEGLSPIDIDLEYTRKASIDDEGRLQFV